MATVVRVKIMSWHVHKEVSQRKTWLGRCWQNELEGCSKDQVMHIVRKTIGDFKDRQLSGQAMVTTGKDRVLREGYSHTDITGLSGTQRYRRIHRETNRQHYDSNTAHVHRAVKTAKRVKFVLHFIRSSATYGTFCANVASAA